MLTSISTCPCGCRDRWPGPYLGRAAAVGRERVFPVRSTWTQAGQSGLLLASLRSICFTLGPDPEVETGPDCGLEVEGGPACVQALGFFLPEVFSESHSGGGDPPAGVVRVGWGRRVCSPPWGLVTRGVSWHTCFFFVKVLMGPETWMDWTLLLWVASKGALDPSACPPGSRSSDVIFAHPSPIP